MTDKTDSQPKQLMTPGELLVRKQRGGARPNSGRPALAEGDKPWRLSVGLKRSNRDLLMTMAQKRKLSMAKMLNLLILQQAEADMREAEKEQGLPKSDPDGFDDDPLA